MTNGFISFNDGIYVRDPVFSNLICKAKAIGFNIIGYDSDSEDREQGQVQNILDNSLKLNKDARLVVLAGYAHIKENSTPKKMAEFLRK